ncbi:hypothetical protein [Calidifontibacillus erzurumensis]|uniref:Uncharacterized protein n=1 Tax=Calidifontibacillus erzurumensis TaxID=2741433 RepID=A0A8J8GCF5_9BACI|nr:hypothetical protein [Calidifontibacillus erzurumensis]NSL50969.1 hypothetical protein [Calidifontibacillus erzurumensis]
MYTVHFYENKNLLLSQWLKNIPSVGDALKIKGRKGKVVEIQKVNETTIHVQVNLEKEIKKAPLLDTNKKKKR